jgi:hypothetical protein
MKRLACALALFAACGGQKPPAAPQKDWTAGLPDAAPAAPPAVSLDAAPAAAATPRPPTPLADAHRDAAGKILATGLQSRSAFAKLTTLCDDVGARPAGSKALDEAIAWAVDAFKADGLDAHTEKVMVGHWERGVNSGEIVAPRPRALHLLALGGSAATPAKGLTAEVVVVDSIDALKKLDPAKVKGKIVFFDFVMITDEKGPHYGEASTVRGHGPAVASQLGAVAALTRSATSRSLRTPHTGGTWWSMPEATGPKPPPDAKHPKAKAQRIPAAAVSTEDADLIARYAARGPVKIHLTITSKQLPPAPSANVVAELRGREKPDEIVLLGAHLDSWDVGQGAHDDGAGVAIVMDALAILERAGLQPRRTIRVVLYTNEELGLDGAEAYAKTHQAELPNHVVAIESDLGSFKPMGFQVGLDDPAIKPDDPAVQKVLAQLADIVTLLAPLDAARARLGYGGADIDSIDELGGRAVLLSNWMDESSYFDYHHTEADTLDKVDPDDLQKNATAMAVVAYVLAEMPTRLGE